MNIVIPKNMKDAISRHLDLAGRTLVMDPNNEIGLIQETGDTVVALRSGDIPVTIEDHSDVGFCGSDWVEEISLKHKVDLLSLSGYEYGRRTQKSPTLDLIAKGEDHAESAESIEPGSMVLTEYPEMTAKFLKEKGLKIAHLERNNGAPSEPEEFRRWCGDNNLVGIRTVHGGVAALVKIGLGYGVMVNETGNTLREYKLKQMNVIHRVTTLLIADKERFSDSEGRVAIREFADKLDEAYIRLHGETEASLQLFGERRI